MITRHVSRILDRHYWTARWVAVGALAFALSVMLGGPR